ncbi:MAG: hypothetical protein V3U75_13615 [Methylococcaceae bacterium]
MKQIIAQCRSGNRCRQWRECEQCAHIRQAKISDIAERGSLQSPYVTYAVVKPLNDSTFTDEKTKLIKAVSKVADGGLWTVETGKNSGLHTNLIIGSSEPFQIETIYGAIGVESSVFANTKLNHNEVRNVASYSSKRVAMPKKDEYVGNLYGRFGCFKTPLAICAENTISPVMAGVALEQMLADRGIAEPESDFMMRPMGGGKDTQEAMRTRYKHNEAEQARYSKAIKNHREQDNNYKHFQRMLAVVAGEIELHGLAYLKGYGVVDKRDLRKFGVSSIEDIIDSSVEQ